MAIHSHPYYKLGRKQPKRAPALLLKDILSGAVIHPSLVNHFGQLEFGLYENDKYGDCGPTSVANLVRLVTGGLLGQEVKPTQDDVFGLYRASGNPNFDPATDADDNGVDMQTMCEALLTYGIGGIKPIAFAKVDTANEDELIAANSIFGGTLWGVDLQVAQQSQTDLSVPTWDFSPSAEWGGHAILNGANEVGSLEDVISWAKRVRTTAQFRQHQLQEAWVVVWEWNIDHPAFQEGIDLNKLADAYKQLTGNTLPIAPTPTPTPGPTPPQPTPQPQPSGCQLLSKVKRGFRKLLGGP